jgi:hypothetical protein
VACFNSGETAPVVVVDALVVVVVGTVVVVVGRGFVTTVAVTVHDSCGAVTEGPLKVTSNPAYPPGLTYPLLCGVAMNENPSSVTFAVL